MAKRVFLVYFLVELAVLVALVSTIGFGWTVLAVLGTFLLGLALAGSQIARHIRSLQAALSGRSSSAADVATDGVLVAVGAILVVIPGLASSLLGALLLMPPTRRLARPVAVAVIGKRLSTATPLVMTYPAGFRPQPVPRDYIDGEVVDVVDVSAGEVTSLQHRTTTPD